MGQVISSILPFTGTALALAIKYVFDERRARRKEAAWMLRVEESMRVQTEDNRKTRLLALKSIITNKELSEQARLDAYDEYKADGGNGWVARYVAKNLGLAEV